ncbi:MAG: M23 family metallopeptidase [Clostridium sp.]|nr:M23 family metallopeptidase [Clostridium sp.]
MQINKLTNCFPNKIKQTAKAALIAMVSAFPLQTAQDQFVKLAKETPVSTTMSTITKGLDIVQNINCRGGVTHCFSDSSMIVLKKRLTSSNIKTVYKLPVDTAIKPYIPSTGQFGSIRPQNRPHLGIDIYPRLYGRKPKEPVAVMSATNGIVVSVKKSPKKDPKNLIANNIKIMSPDGKIYSYDHLGRPEDYKNAKFTELKNIGDIVQAGDTIGTIGKTGETEVWHLHFGVCDLDVQKMQKKNPTWLMLFKNNTVYATPMGQIDPLNKEKAGKISEVLGLYKIDKGPKVDYLDKL